MWNPSEDRMLDRVNARLNRKPYKPKPKIGLNKPEISTGVVISNGRVKPSVAKIEQPKPSLLVVKFKKYSKKISKLVTKLSSIHENNKKQRAFYEAQIDKYKKKMAGLKSLETEKDDK